MAVTAEYQVRPPMAPTHFFLIDVSQPAGGLWRHRRRLLQRGAHPGRPARRRPHAGGWGRAPGSWTAALCGGRPSACFVPPLRPARSASPHSAPPRVCSSFSRCLVTHQVCVATFDATIHFYSMRPGQAQPHMLVVPDIADVYCPLAGNVVVNLSQVQGAGAGRGGAGSGRGGAVGTRLAARSSARPPVQAVAAPVRARHPPASLPARRPAGTRPAGQHPPHVCGHAGPGDVRRRSAEEVRCGAAACAAAPGWLRGEAACARRSPTPRRCPLPPPLQRGGGAQGRRGRPPCTPSSARCRGAARCTCACATWAGRPPTADTLDSLVPESKEYAALATDAAEHQISIDLFVLAQVGGGCGEKGWKARVWLGLVLQRGVAGLAPAHPWPTHAVPPPASPRAPPLGVR